jgi:hypothetical protein
MSLLHPAHLSHSRRSNLPSNAAKQPHLSRRYSFFAVIKKSFAVTKFLTLRAKILLKKNQYPAPILFTTILTEFPENNDLIYPIYGLYLGLVHSLVFSTSKEPHMRIKTSYVLLFLGVLIALMAVAAFPQPSRAQNQTCSNPEGLPVPCTPVPGQATDQPSGRKKPTKIPTSAAYLAPIITTTATLTLPPTETASATAPKPTASQPAPTGTPTAEAPTASPTSGMPTPLNTATPPATPPTVLCLFCATPSSLLIVLGGGLLLGLLAIGLLIYRFFTGPLSLPPAGEPGGTPFPPNGELPAITRGANESATMTVRNANDFGGANESATMTVRNSNDFGGANESATMTVRNVNDFGGANESATMTVRDAGDIAPGDIQPGSLPGGTH